MSLVHQKIVLYKSYLLLLFIPMSIDKIVNDYHLIKNWWVSVINDYQLIKNWQVSVINDYQLIKNWWVSVINDYHLIKKLVGVCYQ